jgi:methanobactin biosynthesis cassette protein MbnC
MAWAAEQRLTFDWSYYLWVYTWLRQSEFRDLLDSELRLSLMAASAARWATFDRSRPGVVALGCVEMQGLVCGYKPRTYDTGRTVEILDLEESLPTPNGLFGFFTLSGPDIDHFPGWSPIPK